MPDHSDTLQRFVFEHAEIRGEVVHLDRAWREVLSRHDYPPVVRGLLGETLTAALLLSATVKMEGSLTLQVQGPGPVTLLVAEVTVHAHGDQLRRTLRGLANWEGEVVATDLHGLFGGGKVVITLQPDNSTERFQSIVALEGAGMADALRAYLRQSEQLETRIWLTSGPDACAGFMLQRLPGCAESDDESWNRVDRLAATVTAAELLALSPQTLLHRLFHEEDLRLFDAEPVGFYCSCSRERVSNMLRSLGRAELEDILREQGRVDVACEFCKRDYHYDAVDVEQLLVSHTHFDTPAQPQ